MSRSLYLFVTSLRPDAYINSIVHCFQHKGISKVILLYIEDNFNPDTDTSQALEISLHIHALLDSLALKGTYVYRPLDSKKEDVDLTSIYGERTVEIKKTYHECHRKVHISPPDDKDIPYPELRHRIAAIHNQEPDSIFDVTAVGKDRLGDIFSVILTEGIKNLHTFNVISRMNFTEPWKSLIHDLSYEKEEYSYVNLLDTPIFRECSSLIHISKPDSEKTTSVSSKKLEEAIEEAANRRKFLEIEQKEKRKQADGWYRASLVAAGVALVLVTLTVISIVAGGSLETTAISTILTAIVGFVTRVFFQQSDKANIRADAELERFNTAQEINTRIQTQLQIIESIGDQVEKDKLKSEIVREVYG